MAVVGCLVNWKEFGRKRPWLNRGDIPELPGRAEENHRERQFTWCSSEARSVNLPDMSWKFTAART